MTQKDSFHETVSFDSFITAQVTQKIDRKILPCLLLFITAQVTQKIKDKAVEIASTFITAQVTQKDSDGSSDGVNPSSPHR